VCLIGALPYVRRLFLTIAQILGGIAAAAIRSALFPGLLTVRTYFGGGTPVIQGLFIEIFLSAELVFTIFMLEGEKHKGIFIAPVGICLSLFIVELTGVYFTGGSVNLARSFGPSVASHRLHSYRGWPHPRRITCTRLLQVHQDARIRDRESKSRCFQTIRRPFQP
jgi:aquaporin related protein